MKSLEGGTSYVIYGDAPFIEDMGILTTLSLLYDKVILIGSNPLQDHLDHYFSETSESDVFNGKTVVEQTAQLLIPESVVSFYSVEDARNALLGEVSGKLEIPGIYVPDKENNPLKFEIEESELNDLSRLIADGLTSGTRTVNSMLRDIILVSAAIDLNSPIVSGKCHIRMFPSETKVAEVTDFLAHKTLRELALPELRAYRAEDILEARVKLQADLQEFRAAMRDLSWLLYERNGLDASLPSFNHDCAVLIETKIKSAVFSLESAIRTHQSKRIRGILVTTAGALLEIARGFLTWSVSGALVGGSAALLKVADSMASSTVPTVPIASFLYKARNRAF